VDPVPLPLSYGGGGEGSYWRRGDLDRVKPEADPGREAAGYEDHSSSGTLGWARMNGMSTSSWSWIRIAGREEGVNMAGRKKSVLLRRLLVGRRRAPGVTPNEDLTQARAP